MEGLTQIHHSIFLKIPGFLKNILLYQQTKGLNWIKNKINTDNELTEILELYNKYLKTDCKIKMCQKTITHLRWVKKNSVIESLNKQ
jgi:hypothetical protein